MAWNSWNPIDLDLIPSNIKLWIDIFWVMWTYSSVPPTWFWGNFVGWHTYTKPIWTAPSSWGTAVYVYWGNIYFFYYMITSGASWCCTTTYKYDWITLTKILTDQDLVQSWAWGVLVGTDIWSNDQFIRFNLWSWTYRRVDLSTDTSSNAWLSGTTATAPISQVYLTRTYQNPTQQTFWNAPSDDTATQVWLIEII